MGEPHVYTCDECGGNHFPTLPHDPRPLGEYTAVHVDAVRRTIKHHAPHLIVVGNLCDEVVSLRAKVKELEIERDLLRDERDWAKNDVRKIGEERNEAIRDRLAAGVCEEADGD